LRSIAKIGGELRAHLCPLARLKEAMAHMQIFDGREVGDARYATVFKREPISALSHLQFEMHGVKRRFTLALGHVLVPHRAVAVFGAITFQPPLEVSPCAGQPPRL